MHFESSDDKVTHKYWIASSSFFDTSLIFYPIHSQPSGDENLKPERAASAEIYDSDGKQVNSISCTFDSSKVSVLEVGSLVEGFKFESGIKHGLIELQTTPDLGVQCRIHSHSNATPLSALTEVSRSQKAFLPLRVGPDTNTLLVLVNLSKDTNNVKGKLYIGSRSPEINISLPGAAVRILSLANEFAECLENRSYSSLAYLRATSKNELPFAVQVLEWVEGPKGEAILSSIL